MYTDSYSYPKITKSKKISSLTVIFCIYSYRVASLLSLQNNQLTFKPFKAQNIQLIREAWKINTTSHTVHPTVSLQRQLTLASKFSIVYLCFLCPSLTFPSFPGSLESPRAEDATDTLLQNFFSTSSSSSSRSSPSMSGYMPRQLWG